MFQLNLVVHWQGQAAIRYKRMILKSWPVTLHSFLKHLFGSGLCLAKSLIYHRPDEKQITLNVNYSHFASAWLSGPFKSLWASEYFFVCFWLFRFIRHLFCGFFECVLVSSFLRLLWIIFCVLKLLWSVCEISLFLFRIIGNIGF